MPKAFERRQRQNVDAGRGKRDVVALVGHLVELVGPVDGGHGDHVLVGGRVERLGLAAAIAGGSDHDDAARMGRFDQLDEQRIARAGEAHVEDPCTLRLGPVHGAFKRHGVGLADALALDGREGADGEDLSARRDALQGRLGADDAGDRGAVRVRPALALRGRVEASDHDILERGMVQVDGGIDDGDLDVPAGRALMGRRNPEHGKGILQVGICGFLHRLVLAALKLVDVMRLHGIDPWIALQSGHGLRHRPAAPDPEVMHP